MSAKKNSGERRHASIFPPRHIDELQVRTSDVIINRRKVGCLLIIVHIERGKEDFMVRDRLFSGM